MFYNTFLRRVLFNLSLIFVFLSIYVLLFAKVYTSSEIMISFAVHPFNICESYPDIWEKLKVAYIPISFLSSLICINHLYSFLFSKEKPKKDLAKVSPNRFIFVYCKR